MAFGDGSFHIPSAIACLLAALLIQIGTNLANDYFDCKKGADIDRVGPTRVTQAGLIKPSLVFQVMGIVFTMAALTSIYLVCRGGLVIALIAVASIISGICYTAGKRPLGYVGLGEVFVLIFFGPVAVGGTYYVQTLDMNWAVVVAGLGPGLLSCAILAVNNLRDMQGDRQVGKNTLAVRFGRTFAITEYLILILLGVLCPLGVYLITRDHIGILAASLIALPAAWAVKTVMTTTDPEKLNQMLAATGALLLVYSILFAAGWVLCSR